MGLLGLICLGAVVSQVSAIKFDDDHDHAEAVQRPDTFGKVDSNGDFGHFTVQRCVKVQEGQALCKYKIHYDVPHNEVSLIGKKGIKCITNQKKISRKCKTEGDNSIKINKKQLVDVEFIQHCVHLKHSLKGKVIEANILESCHAVGKGKGKGKGRPKQ
eukprot:TRINITY_DN811_c0_g1_i4.p1 TRINITY_DN811_c0_g1~~TRINITY_DN811_c0_g1_i4.p1  ORF type:complete len:159 (-),score=39.14 TRINITY_DN811_c0_g1_i4:165-641(-)